MKRISCENCKKFPSCEVVKIIQGGRYHFSWIEMGDKIAKICVSFSPRRGEEVANGADDKKGIQGHGKDGVSGDNPAGGSKGDIGEGHALYSSFLLRVLRGDCSL